MFGTSGIRGIYGKEITTELAERVACLFAEKKLVIGRDIRDSGLPLFKAVCAGTFAAGCDAIDLSIVPTPTVALATLKHGCGGIMLTASHNPPEYNGLKLIKRGKEIDKEMERGITSRYKAGDWSKVWNQGKAVESSLYHDPLIVDDHKAMITSMIDLHAVAKKNPKVIVDCNGAAAVITPNLLSDIGCKVISVNSSTDGFNRPSEPKEDNLTHLPGLIRSSGADFAIAHDGDGDRCIILDDRGSALPFDVQLAMMIEHEMGLDSNKRIVTTVESSLIIREVVENGQGKIDITPVGSTWVGDEMERSGALFGGEPCGEYIYKKGVHVPDAVLAAAKFAEIFCTRGRFSELRKRYRQNFMAREKFPTKDKHKAMEMIKGAVKVEGKLRSDDGIRVDEEDGWFLIRASGTEPIIRLTMEYKSKELLEKRKIQLSAVIRELAR